MINLANLVTVLRVVLGLATLALLWLPGDQFRWAAFILTALVIYGDALDGYIARKLKQSSKFGGILDIAADRAVEMSYWIVFSSLTWIPVWVPLLFVVRGTLVDAIRAALGEQGFTAFGQKTMMQTALGKFLVASNFMRFTYAMVKALAFCLLIAAHTTYGAHTLIPSAALWLVYASCAFCLIRGLPVVAESRYIFFDRSR